MHYMLNQFVDCVHNDVIGKSPSLSLSSDVVDLHELQQSMEKAISALQWEYAHSVVSRMSPSVLDPLQVEFNNKRLPLKELGQISMPNAQTIIVNLSSQPQVNCSCILVVL